jgi:hypothetical protein
LVTDRTNGSRAQSAPEARHLRIPDSAAGQLSVALNWLDLASGGRLSREVIDAAMRHRRELDTPPGVLIAAAVQYLVLDCDREPDRLNRYWTLANQVSARERARYLNLEESELS